MWHYIWSHWRNPHGKFHYDGFWSLFDFESSDTCNFPPKSEVTKIPFTCHKERTTNLLVIIHLMCVVRYRLLVVDLSIFRNDSSRYLDIYLMRRKSGSFEIIRKVLKNEVEVIVTRKLCFCNLIAQRNIWVTCLANVWWVVKGFHNLHLPEHHCKWKVRGDVIKPFMTW